MFFWLDPGNVCLFCLNFWSNLNEYVNITFFEHLMYTDRTGRGRTNLSNQKNTGKCMLYKIEVLL